MIKETKKQQKTGNASKINDMGQKSHADADKQIMTGIISPAVKDTLNGLCIKGMYICDFGWFVRTGRKELTMVMLIESRHFKAEKLVDELKQIVESMGWTFRYSLQMRYSGSVE